MVISSCFLKRFTTVAIACAGISVLSILGCGGGGGGGTTPFGYSGLTTQATIDSGNAVAIASAAYQGGISGGALAKPGADGGLETPSGGSILLATSRMLENLVRHTVSTGGAGATGPSGMLSKAVTTSSISGPCGGTSSGTINYYNQTTGDFRGSFTFEAYCSQGVIFSGNVQAEGTLDRVTGNPIQVTLIFSVLKVTSGGETFTAAGIISIDSISSTQETVTIDMLMRDDASGKMFQTVGYRIDATGGTDSDGKDYADLSISGTFYHSDHGYVVISTQEPIHILLDADWPSSGVLVVNGKTIEGASEPTSARLTVIDASSYHVEADVDGDGVYDSDSGTKYWAAL